MSAEQYSGEQDIGLHTQPLTWPGANGYPMLGTPHQLLRTEELRKVPVIGIFRSRTFNVSELEDHRAYDGIMERIYNKWFRRVYIERWRDPATGARFCYVEWVQFYSRTEAKQ